MHILAAFSNYKNSLSANAACEVAQDLLSTSGFTVDSAPLTDGGEGFCSILTNQLNGKLVPYTVKGPTFNPMKAHIGWVEINQLSQFQKEKLNLRGTNGKLAIIEMAEASGYECLSDDERNAWHTSSHGTGELIKIAAENKAEAILLGIGGSATNDCGAGAMEALGVIYYDHELQPVTQVTPFNWNRITSLGGNIHVGSQFPPIRIACDVDNPLLGTNGATAIYGPQKGIKTEDIDRLDRLMKKMANRFLGLFGKDSETWDDWHQIKSTGAAGGIGFALKSAFNDVEFVEGFSLCADLVNLSQKIEKADIILTGEGRLDASSLSGKGPYSLLAQTRPNQKVYILPGSVEITTKKTIESQYNQVNVVELKEPQWDIHTSIRETKSQLILRIKELIMKP